MISLQDYLTSSGKYPERAAQASDQVIKNATVLLSKLNPFLDELGMHNCTVDSGFRTAEANAALPNSAAHSLHMIGSACDLADPSGSLDALISNRDDLKKKYKLWQESPDSTEGWSHVDDKDRGIRAENTFIP